MRGGWLVLCWGSACRVWSLDWAVQVGTARRGMGVVGVLGEIVTELLPILDCLSLNRHGLGCKL